MQYGVEVSTYNRVRKKRNKSKSKLENSKLLNIALYFSISFFVSRVLLLNVDQTIAPFGIAFVIVMTFYKEEDLLLPCALGSFFAYMFLIDKVSNIYEYFIVLSTIVILAYLIGKFKRETKLAIILGVVFIEMILSEIFISGLSINIAFFNAFLQMTCIFPLYFMIGKSIICFRNIKTKHLYNSEEILSMAILVSLIISGTWGLDFYGLSLKNLLGFLFILIMAYVNGSTTGAASGIALGAIIGMSSNNILIYISVFGTCGLIAGLFRDSGKWISGTSSLMIFLILKLYANLSIEFNLLEVIIPCIIFFVLPGKVYNKFILELDWEKKQRYLNKDYIDKMKTQLTNRLFDYSNILENVSEVLFNLAENDKLAMKNKGNALVEKLADRVCSNCDMSSICWKRENYITYAAFGELIENYEEGRKGVIPHEIERKCIKRTLIMSNTEEIVNNHIISEMSRKKVSESRNLLSSHIKRMSSSIKELTDDFNDDVKMDFDTEKKVRKLLENKGIKFKDIYCINDKNERVVIYATLPACCGVQLCVKKIVPLLNQVLKTSMCIRNDGCDIDKNTNLCRVVFEETPKYYVSTYATAECKKGNKFNGDSYCYGKLQDDSYINVISDGMGSGIEANQESKATIDLMKTMIKSGFNENSALNMVNSVMTLKFSEDEKFSTVDLMNINLYTGELDFMKVGAVASFIKTGKEVKVITSNTLPIGVLDTPDIDAYSTNINNGDIIVMVSDGILDYDSTHTGKYDWVLDYIKYSNINKPKELAEGILENAKKLSGGYAKDDMTVIVSKVYDLY
ncbi:stage II sporulation protein E [Clostridium sediminicola]|uniref:stage II sporulation protein E n=1 Tax=Clostridium sediminicola TaxID=3114879 RepID=UPI0031F21655